MKDVRYPVTRAIHVLRQAKVAFTPHVYRYEERGGTRVSAAELGVDEHCVLKTLVFETDKKAPLLVLMHGGCEVSANTLARLIGARSVTPCTPDVADKHSGYQVGGTSPFGTRKPMPVYLQESVLQLPVVYINGGAKGFLVSLGPAELVRVLTPTVVDVAIPR